MLQGCDALHNSGSDTKKSGEETNDRIDLDIEKRLALLCIRKGHQVEPIVGESSIHYSCRLLRLVSSPHSLTLGISVEQIKYGTTNSNPKLFNHSYALQGHDPGMAHDAAR